MLGVARKAVDVDTFAPSQSRNRTSCIPCDLTNFNVGDQVDPVIILFFPM